MSTNPSSPISIAILIVAYNGRDDLVDCLNSLRRTADREFEMRIVVVDNASTDDTREVLGKNFPEVALVPSAVNRGFAGGNNLGWEWIRTHHPEVKSLVLLNQDTIASEGWLEPLIARLESHPHFAAVQPKIRLHSDTERINSVGNRCHYLGFGFMTGYGELDRGQYDRLCEIDSASGAALVVRTDLVERVGLFDESLFMYLEDVELAWKLRQIGYRVGFAPKSVITHKYTAQAPYRSYYYLERNRWILLLTYYRVWTLVLIAPALLLMEAGQWLFALRHGLVRQRVRVYRDFCGLSMWQKLRAGRRVAQGRRTVGDRDFMAGFTGRIDIPTLDSPLVRWIANPILGAWWRLVRPFLA